MTDIDAILERYTRNPTALAAVVVSERTRADDFQSTIDTLTAQLAAAEARVAERDAVLRAVGFEGERLALVKWAVANGFCRNDSGIWSCSKHMPRFFFELYTDYAKVGNDWLTPGSGCWYADKAEHPFQPGQHAEAWAAFQAARSGEV